MSSDHVDEEASYEADDERFCSRQWEDNDSTCSSSCESDADWEEESNEGSECPFSRESISSFSRSENESEFLSLNCISHHAVESFEEELFT